MVFSTFPRTVFSSIDASYMKYIIWYFTTLSYWDLGCMHHRESSSNKLISVVIYTANPKFVLLFSFLVSADVYDAQMSPLEAVVLNAMMTGSSILNFRAHFLNQLPDMSPLAGMLTHLNLSFNDLWVSTDLKLSFVFYIRRTVWELLKDKLMTSPGPYLAITQKYLSFTSLCLALKKFSGLTKNGGGGGLGTRDWVESL